MLTSCWNIWFVVGAGAGKVFKGAGKGVGQVFGGGEIAERISRIHCLCEIVLADTYEFFTMSLIVTGGAQQIGKGVAKGVTEGDGKAVLTGLGEGVASVGTGVGQGVGTVVTGAADGFLAVGSGITTGFKSIGKGIGGVFGGKKPRKPNKKNW